MTSRRFAALTIGLILLTALGAGCAGTQKNAAPQAAEADWRFDHIVDTAYVKQHIRIPMPEGSMIIDSRPKRAKYDRGHIPMAVSMPDTYFEKMTDKLPQDKEALLIFYCGGLKCKLSHKSAGKAEALGYTNVKVYAAGFPGWMAAPGNYASVSAQWIKSKLDKKEDMTLVDARPKRTKYDKGHVPTAISIPNTRFDKLTDRLPAEKDKLLVFYCGGLKCKLSHKSAVKAIGMGYTNVKVFSTGYPAWKALMAASGQSATAQGASSLKAGKEEGTIDNGTFLRIVKENPASVHFIDVRDPDEFTAGSLKTAKNIPVDQLEEKIKTLPADKPIVFICGTGARSGESFYMVQDLRPELKRVYYVEAEMTFKKDGSFELTEPVH